MAGEKIDTSTRKIIQTAPIGKRPDMMAISSDGKRIVIQSEE